MTADVAVPSRRERVREATKDEIKTAALELLCTCSASDLKFTDIARELGMTAPALYRYYNDRNDLLSALIFDAYTDMARSLHEASDHLEDPRAAAAALAHAYRGFAVADPVRFGLIFGLPIPDYEVPESVDTKGSAADAMAAVERVAVIASAGQPPAAPLIPAHGRLFIDVLREGHSQAAADLSPEALQSMFLVWSTLHGFTCLEAFNHLDWMPDEAREQFFDAQIELCWRILGL